MQGKRPESGSEIEDLLGTFKNCCSEPNETLKDNRINLGRCLRKDGEMLLLYIW